MRQRTTRWVMGCSVVPLLVGRDCDPVQEMDRIAIPSHEQLWVDASYNGVISAQFNPQREAAMSTFAGRWVTTFGLMELSQEGEQVHGTYWSQGLPCTLEGRIEGA